uniref:uncharacterized protein LOC105352478 n=1 Tax=Fragaria vesca subsp. vesca TaxID=101020 RepID=UPI0005CAD264|nr:PREDICTED: uncharacterized protein LOC105352478 [Fragaria vesca subsp. vesca]
MLMYKYKESIPEESWELINSTCFQGIIEAFKLDKVKEDQVKKLESDFEILMRHYNSDNKNFIFGNTEIEITEHDVHSIFGITKEGSDVDITIDQKYCKGSKKNLADSAVFGKQTRRTITRKVIDDTLMEELRKIQKKKGDPRKIASLVIMYLMAALFFSRSGNHIEWKLILKCEDLEDIDRYNWSHKVLEFLHQGLHKHVKGEPRVLNGCLLLVLYWFYTGSLRKQK